MNVITLKKIEFEIGCRNGDKIIEYSLIFSCFVIYRGFVSILSIKLS